MNQVDNIDANFLFLDESDNPAHISLLYMYDQSTVDDEMLRFKKILNHMQERLSSSPLFRQKILRVPFDLDYPYWVDDEKFDLEFHIRHLALPKPGDWRQLCIQVSRLHSRPLDISKPLWEMYIIEGLDNIEGIAPGAFAVFLKIHHCAMDEFAAMNLYESLHTSHTNDNASIPPCPAPSRAYMLARACGNNLNNVIDTVGFSLRNISGVTKMAARVVGRFLLKTAGGEIGPIAPSTRFNYQLTPYRVFDGLFFDADVFEKIMKRFPAITSMELVATICGGALRSYLDEKGELPIESLFALLAINDRDKAAHALRGNHFGIKRQNLRTDISHPIDRLRAISVANANVQINNNGDDTSDKVKKMLQTLPAPILSLANRYANNKGNPINQVLRSGNAVITLFDDTAAEHNFMGAELIGFTSISPLYSGCGLVFTATRFNDKLGITFTSDREMLTDPEKLRESLRKVYEELADYCENDKSPVRICA